MESQNNRRFAQNRRACGAKATARADAQHANGSGELERRLPAQIATPTGAHALLA